MPNSVLKLSLTAADRVTNFSLIWGNTSLGAGVRLQSLALYNEATATTSAVGNITGSVEVWNNSGDFIQSKLTLGADLLLAGQLFAHGHSITIDALGHNITANGLSLTYDVGGSNNPPNIRLLNDGAITIHGPLALAGGVQADLRGGNDSARACGCREVGLRIKSAATGFTLTGTTADDLLFNGTRYANAGVNGKQSGWVFRWANPAGATTSLT